MRRTDRAGNGSAVRDRITRQVDLASVRNLFAEALGHVSNILSKLGVRDRTRAVLRAIELAHI